VDTGHAAQSGQLTVVATAADGIHVLTLSGEIDHHTGDTLRHALAVPDTPDPRVVLDMHRVTFMDSSGINILIAAHHALSRAGGWLRLAAPTHSVRRTMNIVGVDEFIDCRETVRQALSS